VERTRRDGGEGERLRTEERREREREGWRGGEER